MPCAYVVADDLTGALDTGVVFVRSRVPATVFSSAEDALACREPGVVAVINGNYRHRSPDGARAALQPIADALASLNARCYIKTDSGLRGNIGPAFEVFLNAFEGEPLPFVPAYPALGRTTRDGLHYIQGVPVGQSALANDPLNPVLSSRVRDILLTDASFPVHTTRDAIHPPAHDAVTVYDAQTEQDLSAIAKAFARHGAPWLAAGCAGFAAYLPGLWSLPRIAVTKPEIRRPMAVFSGTASSTSLAQLSYAIAKGISWQRVDIGEVFFQSARPRPPFDPMPFVSMLSKENMAILTTTLSGADLKRTDALMAEAGLDRNAGCAALTQSFAKTCVEILRASPHALPVVFGGDTLLEILSLLHFRTIQPKDELFPGIVLSQVEDDLGAHDIITKSGHFGEEDLLTRLAGLAQGTGGDPG